MLQKAAEGDITLDVSDCVCVYLIIIVLLN